MDESVDDPIADQLRLARQELDPIRRHSYHLHAEMLVLAGRADPKSADTTRQAWEAARVKLAKAQVAHEDAVRELGLLLEGESLVQSDAREETAPVLLEQIAASVRRFRAALAEAAALSENIRRMVAEVEPQYENAAVGGGQSNNADAEYAQTLGLMSVAEPLWWDELTPDVGSGSAEIQGKYVKWCAAIDAWLATYKENGIPRSKRK